MSGDLEERMGQLCDELQQALDAGQSIDTGKLAERFAIPEPDVQKALQALQAMHDVLGEDATAQAAELAPPRLSDDYEVLDELGRGGMGVVYRAHQKSLDRDLAVKVLRPGDLMFGDAIRRFEREAKSLAKLRHRHIVSVHEVGKSDGFVYFTMDLIDGCTLAERLQNGPMPATQAVKLLLQVSSAMAYAHGKGVMHRDLKPGNILLDGNDDAFVCDFGLARELGHDGAATMTGQMLGTPAYMSPEQALGDRDKIGEQTDVYALGAILYECLAGKAPFAGLPLAQLMNAVLEKEPTPLRKRNARVPVDLQVIVEKAMRKDPAERYATVQALAEDLERFSIGKDILARPRSGFGQALSLVGRHRTSILGALLPAAIALVAVWWFVLPSLQRTSRISVATALAEAGNTQGAATVCVDLFEGTSPDDLSIEERTIYLEALTNEAARSYLFDEGHDTSAADRLIVKASHVVLDASKSTTAGAYAAASEEQRAAFDHARRRLYAFGVDVRPAGVPKPQQVAPSGRLGDAMRLFQVLAALHADEPMIWSADQRAAIPALLRAAHRLPHLPALRLRGALFGNGSPAPLIPAPAYEFVDRVFLDALAAVAADRSQPRTNRQDAARLLHLCAWLPFLHESADGKDLVVDDAALAWLAEVWPQVHSVGGSGDVRTRADLVAARLASTPPDAQSRQLQRWLAVHTGCLQSEPAEAAAWWQDNRTASIRDLLRQALAWGSDKEPTVDRLLDGLRQRPRQRAWLHHLMVEVAPTGIRIPYEERAPDDTLITRWERALGAVEQVERQLRIGVIARIDHAVEPSIVWQDTIPVRGESQVAFEAPIERALTFTRFFFGTVRPPKIGEGGEPATLVGTVRTQWRAGQFDLEGDVRFANLRHPEMYLHLPVHDELRPASYVTELGRGSLSAPDGSSFECVVLASLRPVDEPASTWSIPDWRRALASSLQQVADADYPHQLHQIRQLATATFLHVPRAQGALATIDAKLDDVPQQGDGQMTYRSDMRLAARLFAGDEAALDAPQPKQRDGALVSSYAWIRLALATNSERIRDYAWSRAGPLHDGHHGDGMARALAQAREAGVVLPPAMDARSKALYSPLHTYVRRSLSSFVMFGISLAFLLTGAVLVLARPKSLTAVRGVHLLVVFGLLTTGQHVWIDGIEWYPSYLPLGLTILGAWTLAAHPRGSLWAMFVACLWTATAALVAFEQLPHSGATWFVPVALLVSVWWRATFHAASRRSVAKTA